MSARHGSIGREITGQQADVNHTQGDTGMQAASATTTSTMTVNADRAAHRLAGLLRTAWLSLILALGLGMAGTAHAALGVSLTAPADNTVELAPASFTLNAGAANPQGAPIKSIAFYASNGKTNTLLGTVAAPAGPGSITLPAQAARAPVATSGTTTYTWSWSNVPMGIYTLTAVVTDQKGDTATSSPVTVIADVPPTAAITRPADNSSAEPGDIPLSANATSALGTIAKVEFYAATLTNGTPGAPALIGTATTGASGTYSATWSNAPLGKYILTAIATDNWGMTGASGPVTFTVTDPRPYYIHADQIDTPREITDQAGQVVWQWDNQDPFGNNVPNQNPSGQGNFQYNQRFPGQYYDKETNLHYNINRDYDPAIGRYIQSDPIGLEGGINTYTYVNDNPLLWSDLYGLYCLSPATIDALSGGVGGGIGGAIAGAIAGAEGGPATAIAGAIGGGVSGAGAGFGAGAATHAIGPVAGGAIAGAPAGLPGMVAGAAGGEATDVLGGSVGGAVGGQWVVLVRQQGLLEEL